MWEGLVSLIIFCVLVIAVGLFGLNWLDTPVHWEKIGTIKEIEIEGEHCQVHLENGKAVLIRYCTGLHGAETGNILKSGILPLGREIYGYN